MTTIVLAMRKLGVNAVQVINRKELLHRPESRNPSFVEKYPDWLKDFSDLPEEKYIAGGYGIDEVINFLTHDVDAMVLNGVGPSLAKYCDLPYLSVLSGSDASYYANWAMVEHQTSLFENAYRKSKGYLYYRSILTEFIQRQREGIRNSVAVHTAPVGSVASIDEVLTDIGVSQQNRIELYMTNVEFEKVSNKRKVSNKKFRILNGARLCWKRPLPTGVCDQDNKRTDLLLKAFKIFLEHGACAELVLIRKGVHIRETEWLVEQLGLSDDVIWMDEMDMSTFHTCIQSADVVCDQFGNTTPGLVAIDAMGFGVPVVSNFNLPVFKRLYPGVNFFCHAETPEQIAEQFSRLYESKSERERISFQSTEFVKHYCTPEAVAQVYLQRLGLG